MSYQRPDTGNSLNDYMSALTDFIVLAPKLLDAKNINSFQIWLDKLEAIDRRALFLYLRKNKNKIPAKRMKLAQRRYVKTI